MSNQELERAQAELKRIGADWALLSSCENVTYVSHFEVPVDFGALAAMTHSPCLSLFSIDGTASCIIVSSFYGDWAAAQNALDEVVTYEVFGQWEPLSARDNFLEALRGVLKDLGVGTGKGKLAIEEKTLPAMALRLLQREFPNVEPIEAGDALSAARLVKTEREISLLRFASEVANAGHKELTRQCAEANKNEHDMWAAVTRSMQMKADTQLYVFGELVTGERCTTVAMPGGPKDVVTKPGDLALMDISPRVDGYWSDLSNTMVIGGVEPTRKQKLYGVAAREAFYAASEMLRPGREAHEAFDAAKAAFAKYGLKIGHYGGHQIGVSVNEIPQLVPYEKTIIQAGMVFSSENGSYEGPGGQVGARMEKSVIVHQSGPEIIPDFEWGF